MGKLTLAQADALKKTKLLDDKTITQMQDDGLISKGRRNSKRFMKTADGKYVSPQLYFQGINGGKYSKKMDAFRVEFQTLVNKYAVKTTNNK